MERRIFVASGKGTEDERGNSMCGRHVAALAIGNTYIPKASPDRVKELLAVLNYLAAAGIKDPTLGLYSPSFANLNASLTQAVNDGVSDIVQGRRPVSDLDGIVATWRSNGGDTIRQEYQSALAARG